jgi:hypothetical protein
MARLLIAPAMPFFLAMPAARNSVLTGAGAELLGLPNGLFARTMPAASEETNER